LSQDGAPLTQLLNRMARTDGTDAVRVLEQVYEELRRIAASEMIAQPIEHSLQATALINEAVLKILRAGTFEWRSRKHFFATAALAMRQILVDCARRRRSRTDGRPEIIARLLAQYEARAGDIEALDAALQKLASFNPLGAQLVGLKFFVDLPMQVVADTLDLPLRTAEHEWKSVRAWLYQELRHDA
jgi:RNA polymerase sigma factor (TIGR02999 family)